VKIRFNVSQAASRGRARSGRETTTPKADMTTDTCAQETGPKGADGRLAVTGSGHQERWKVRR